MLAVLEDLPAYSLEVAVAAVVVVGLLAGKVALTISMAALVVKVIAVALAVLMAVGLGQVPTGELGDLEVTQAVQGLTEVKVLRTLVAAIQAVQAVPEVLRLVAAQQEHLAAQALLGSTCIITAL